MFHQISSEIIVGIISGSKYWTLDMIKQMWEKIESFFNEIWKNLTTDTIQYWNKSFEYLIVCDLCP